MSQQPSPGFGQPLPQSHPHHQNAHYLHQVSHPLPPQPASAQYLQQSEPPNPGQQQPGQLYPGRPHSGQPHPGQPHHGQPHPEQPNPAQPSPAHPNRPEFRVAAVRQHARRVIVPSLILIAASGFIGYCFRGLRDPGDWLWWGILAGVAAVLLGFVPILAWLRNRYQITTVRTISRRGLLRSAKREIAHHQVVNVEMKRNPWQALFGSGTIRLTAVNGRVFELKDVPNAVTITQALRELTGNINRHEEAAPEQAD